MKDTVIIKSFQNGISLHLNSEVDFEQIIQELAYKFYEARNFFGSSSMAISFEDRELTDMEEIRILETIRENSDVRVVCIVGKDETTNKNFIKALQHMEKKMSGGEDGQFYKGNVTNKEVLETENSIIVMGDVEPGCAVISAKSIIILGGLYGEAYAGGNGQPAFVAALEMAPERLKVGDFKYKTNGKKGRWGIKPKVQPKIAYVKNDQIIFEPITKDLLSSF